MFAFPPGPRALLRAIATIRRRTRGAPFDVVHAHFGLAALPALAARRGPVVVTLHGNDLFVRRSQARDARGAPVHRAPRRRVARVQPQPAGRGRAAARRGAAGRHRARALPADPARGGARAPRPRSGRAVPALPARSRAPLKRFDRAREAAGDVPLLTLGSVAPDEVPYWINAANAVLVPSQDEGFGLSVIEALACGVPAFGTPVGIHPVALHGIEGAFCEEWDARALARGAAARARGGRPAGRRPRPRGAVLRRPDGGARRRGVARDRCSGRPAAPGRAGARPILGGSSASATALTTDHERTSATHQALARRRRRRAPAEEQAAAPEDAPTTAETPAAGRRDRPDRDGPARTGQPATADPPAIQADPDVPAGLDPAESGAPPATGRRGRLRRRLRYLRRARELMLRDLGGLLYEVHRTGGGDLAAHSAVVGDEGRAARGPRRRGRRDRDGARRPARRGGRVPARASAAPATSAASSTAAPPASARAAARRPARRCARRPHRASSPARYPPCRSRPPRPSRTPRPTAAEARHEGPRRARTRRRPTPAERPQPRQPTPSRRRRAPAAEPARRRPATAAGSHGTSRRTAHRAVLRPANGRTDDGTPPELSSGDPLAAREAGP